MGARRPLAAGLEKAHGPIGYIGGRMNRLSFGLKLLVAFFACDALVRLRLCAMLLAAHVPLTARPFVDRYFPLLLMLAIDVLLAGLIALRTRSGRFWGIIFLGALAVLAAFRLVVEPARFADLPPVDRARELGTIAMYCAFLGILSSRRAARTLVR